MKIQEVWRQENDRITERYDWSVECIGRIQGEDRAALPYRSYFCYMAGFAGQIDELLRLQLDGGLKDCDLADLKNLNNRLYQDIIPEYYENSYANPSYAVRRLGKAYGGMLSFFCAEFRSCVVLAFECRKTEITILFEALVELYNLFGGELPEPPAVKAALCRFAGDYADIMLTCRIRESVDPGLTFIKDIILNEELTDLRYLYRFGDYISSSELKMASFLNTLPEETIVRMADTFTEGYKKGFQVTGRDLDKKKTVAIIYRLGMERMVRQAIANFRRLGLEPILYRAPLFYVNQTSGSRSGVSGYPANTQYDYDHRYDSAIYFDKAFKQRMLGVMKTAYEMYRQPASDYAGPAVIEVFGREGFNPVNKPEAYILDKTQEKLMVAYANEARQIMNQYIPGDETSFTIIAFPVPEIGADFAEIFKETIRINTLDYEMYKKIQQSLIDTLDQADYVTVTGKNGNLTDLRISLRPLQDRTKQTNFENCVADINIPLGEVFTSPALAGTNGRLHVSSVYIGDIRFVNLEVAFKNGMTAEYSCDNFEDWEAGKALIKQLILKNHDTLPMGEFAIGTNTVAYQMAKKFGIIEKLPILIIEKMGPHFALGDTCYSWSEDSPVYNPDGKEIVAKENEISVLRKEDVSKAYFNCHTDITIPYSELGDITAVAADGSETRIIRDGRFVLPGTEELNQAFQG